MKSPQIIILAWLLLPVAAALAVDIQLTVTRKTPLKGELEDRVTFGLLKEMTCDSDGNIFSPSNRKYGDAINAVIRFPHDASSFTTFSIDSDDALDGGTITDFDLEPSGELFVLARQVLKYSDLEVPIEFGKNFLLHYNRNGKVLSRLELKLDANNFKPTGIAMLQDGKILVVGRQLESEKTYLIVEILSSDGSLQSQNTLNPDGTKTSKNETALSERVFDPAAVKANGLVYVLRGTTTEPIYVLSQAGRLLRTIQLKPADIEFDSPKILEDELTVRDHLRQPPQSTLSVFSLETGDVVDRYFWQHTGAAGLACATPPSLTFIGQDVSDEDIGWAIFETVPGGGTSRTKPSATGH